ncbi:MAG TPA: superoxide dismutase family protein [Sphingomonas sp.]|nr:superoxide dismutase family protein [Sphingomonas sp.]
MRWTGWIGAATMLAALTGCSDAHRHIGQPLPYAGRSATAVLHDARGAEVGRAVAREVEGGLRITLEVHGLPPGDHGAHVHTVGRCDPPGFDSAGGHWNPLGAHHGTLNPAGPHMGDLPNLVVAPDGRGALGVNVPGATMAGLLDADGSAIVVHAGRDDMMSDPSGNSGGRIACGVFAAG